MAHVTESGPVERLVRKDQWIVATSSALIVGLAVWYTIAGLGMNMSALDMTRMARPIGEPMMMGMEPVWTPAYAVLMFFMWWIMMIAMMTPSAAPMLLLYTAIKRRGAEGSRAVLYSFLFLSGYLAIWAAFSIAAVGLQWMAEVVGLSNGPMMTLQSRTAAAVVLLAAGLYQLTGLKEACLKKCQSPAHFLANHSRPGATGAFVTGVDHGIYCLGCCWALMALLFVGGIMNLYWIVGIALYVLAEKMVPYGRLLSRVTGFGLIGFAGYLLLI
ncbi:MAG: DUF2182 domain-containing protein [Verrucomicrobia bacterium]|nr:DUF2182 domain-containing protein [Verrucomicrobiota bacterium]